ncbi:MAG TPA: S8 family serine peptidase [Gemmatimonadaceae bacterium]|nr:S8 family serine peptidase [Gemmatimonadaceae bacterium]
MSRFVTASLAAIAAAALAACSDVPVTPDMNTHVPQALSLGVSQNDDADDVVDGEVLVKFKDNADADKVAKGRGLALGQRGFKDEFVVLKGKKGDEASIAADLKNDPRVEWAEPNYLRHPTVDATIYSKLWAFYNPGGLNMKFSDGSGTIPSSYASVLDADEDNVATNYATGGAIVTIGSIDTGVQLDHEQFAAGQLIAGRDWYSNDDNPFDEDGHGTHTTGTMAGKDVGVAGVSGAGTNVRVYVQRVCGPPGCPTSAIINAINAAASYVDAQGNHLVAVNMSLGGGSESTGEANAIKAATANGVLVIASAGNSGSGRVACPACDANAISVAATNWKDEKAAYSQYGKGLDIAAPGGYCYSNTTPEGCIYSSYLGVGGKTYEWLQGTSMAAPQVTGSAGVVASVTGLRGSALRSQILSTVDKPSTLSRYSVGRLNTYRAVKGTSLGAGQ